MAAMTFCARGTLAAALVALGCLAGAASAQRMLSADAYLDKARGMFMGQILGNKAGVPVEGHIAAGGLAGPIDWDSFIYSPTWVGDDDTVLDYMNMALLKAAVNPSPQQIQAAWTSNFTASSPIYCANKQAWYLMQPPPVGANALPPQTGCYQGNPDWWTIDAQITTESLGTVAPGMRQRAADLTRCLGGVTNDGLALHAAQFYAAMYSAGALDAELPGATYADKVESLVQAGLAVVPATSRTHQVILDVVARYQADKAAGLLADPERWRQTQTMLYNSYGVAADSTNYRYRSWVESTVNVGLTTMALLYGQGAFTRTVEIGALGGYDADCNPATAGGLLGMLRGYAGPNGIAASLPATPSDVYDPRMLRTLTSLTTVSQIAQDYRSAAEAQILAAGGAISGTGADRIYTLPADGISAPLEKPDPAGPKGLVALARAAGASVSPSASFERHYPNNDPRNLDAVIDGITDTSYNGHRSYTTDDGDNPQPSGGDWYRLSFGRMMAFDKVIFYEGELTVGLSANPRAAPGPAGGFFTCLTVEVALNGLWTQVANLRFSEPLDPFTPCQTIELTFDRLLGDSLRIRGDAGGTRQFTTIIELEAYGLLLTPGDANADGLVDLQDFGLLKDNVGLTQGATWGQGDFNADGMVDLQDFGVLKEHFGEGSTLNAIPEPASMAVLALLALSLPKRGGLAMLRRRRR